MTLPIFLTDVDDVLANFCEPTVRLISEVLGREWSLAEMSPGKWDMFEGLTKAQYEQIKETIQDDEWIWALEPTPGSQEAIEILQGMSEVYAVTASMNCAPVRIRWLQKHYKLDKYHMVFTKAKHQVTFSTTIVQITFVSGRGTTLKVRGCYGKLRTISTLSETTRTFLFPVGKQLSNVSAGGLTRCKKNHGYFHTN